MNISAEVYYCTCELMARRFRAGGDAGAGRAFALPLLVVHTGYDLVMIFIRDKLAAFAVMQCTGTQRSVRVLYGIHTYSKAK